MQTKNKKMKLENIAIHLALLSALFQPSISTLQAAPASGADVEQYYSSLGIKTPANLFDEVHVSGSKARVAATDDATQKKIEWLDAAVAQEKSADSQMLQDKKAKPSALAPVLAPTNSGAAPLSQEELNKEEELSQESILELKKKYLPSNIGGKVPSDEAPVQKTRKSVSVENAVLNRAQEPEARPSKNTDDTSGSFSAFKAIPKPKTSDDIAGSMTSKNNSDDGGSRDQNQISITNTRNPRRGINIKAEVPSVRHLTMSPASKKFGGDDVEIVISPIYEVLIQMPEAIDTAKSSSLLLVPTQSLTNPQLVSLKLSKVTSPTPISLHVVDIAQNIYTFTIVGVPADLSWEYPKTIIVTRRSSVRTELGGTNPKSIDDALDVDDAIQVTVGDKVNTDEYNVQFVSGRFMHYEGYVQYAFRISKKDESKFKRDSHNNPMLKFTAWANNRRLDAGNIYGGQSSGAPRDIEWTIQPVLSKRDSRRAGHEVLAVFLQIRASILDLEEWTSAFITVSDDVGYSRHDFEPIMRTSRAPVKSTEGDEGN